MGPLLPAAALGFVLGMQHATDPDHLVAVATIATRERRVVDGVRVGLFWGLGHMLTLTVAGAVIVALGLSLGPAVRVVLELMVALMLVLLGASRLRDATRGLDTVAADHLTARHTHDHDEAVHSHAHAHGPHVHSHPHLHPSRRLLRALSLDGGCLAARAALIGVVHGMAGSAAMSLLVLATLDSAWSATVYLAVFGLGTIAGMTLFTAAMAYPVAVLLRFRRARRVLAFGASLGSIVFGLFYAWRLI
jgi:high-affinity nickel-transport protein